MNRGSSSGVPAAGGVGDGSSSSSVADSSGAGWEGGDSGGRNARGAEVAEAEIASLRRQMKAATQVSCLFVLSFFQPCASNLVWKSSVLQPAKKASSSDKPKSRTFRLVLCLYAPRFCKTNDVSEEEWRIILF